MNIRTDGNGKSCFFYALGKRIICRVVTGYVKFAGKVGGGVEYWRGGVIGKKGGGAQCDGVGEFASLHGGSEGLAGNAKSGGALGGASVLADKCGNHGVISKARQRVVPYAQSPDGCQMLVALVWQCCDGRPYKGQSVFSMPLAGA